MFEQFYKNATLPISLLSYFATLISKVDSPLLLGKFRPIFLIGSLYKLVVNVLDTRLRFVMNTLISPNQSTFLRGRQLVDKVVALNGVIHLTKTSKKANLILKVDFEKACDSIHCSFMNYMLKRVSFGDQGRA